MATNQPKTRGAVIVTRVSTDRQTEHGTSLESQLEACRTKAAAIGIPVIAEYADEGISGGLLLARDGMQSAIADIKAGRADTLICASLSRYSRDTEHQQSIKKTIRAAGGSVVFCDMTFDDTPEGDLAFSIMGGFAEYERKVIRARTMRGKRKRAEEGMQPQRSQQPFGYVIPTKADVLRGTYPPELLGKYLIAEDKAAIVRRIFEGYGGGEFSLPTLARALNRDGVRTPRESAFWRASSLRNILTNTVYKGEPNSGTWRSINDESRIGSSHPINGIRITTAHSQVRTSPDQWIRLSAPPIVSTELWDQVAVRLTHNRANCGGNPNRIRMLSGRLVCPVCGGKAIAHGSKTRGKTYGYYICSDYLTHRDQREEQFCSGVVYPIETIESAVITAIGQACETPQAIVAAREAYLSKHGGASGPDIEAGRREINRDLAELVRDEQAAIQAQIEGIKAGASPGAYASIFQQIAERRRASEAKLDSLSKLTDKTQAAQTQPANIGKPLLATQALQLVERALTSPNVPDADKRNIVGSLVDKVVCRKDGADVHFLPTIWSNQSLQITLTTSSNIEGLTSNLPCLRTGMPANF